MSTKSAVSRRSLLAGVAASAILPWRLSRAASPRPDWEDLAKLIASPVLLPNDPRFVSLTQPENLYYYRPAGTPLAPMAVVQPPRPDAIATSVKWAADQNIPLVARSGGHSYAGCSTVPGLIINTAALRHVAYDPSSNLLEIDGGALNVDIFKALQGLRPAAFKDGMAIVHGRCGAVGVSAYLMGGGTGFDMRSFGAGCDLVDSVDVALADGAVVTASKDQNSDLFWALRGGGGGNLGIATRWRLRPFCGQPGGGFRCKLAGGKRPADAIHPHRARPGKFSARTWGAGNTRSVEGGTLANQHPPHRPVPRHMGGVQRQMSGVAGWREAAAGLRGRGLLGHSGIPRPGRDPKPLSGDFAVHRSVVR
jgi:hypothetical protein